MSVSVVPVGHDESMEAPFFSEDGVHESGVLGYMDIANSTVPEEQVSRADMKR